MTYKTRNKHIVFINQSAGYLMIDIIHAFLPHYEQVTLITGKLNPRNTPLNARVKVQKIVPYDRSSTLKRLWTWGLGSLQILWLLLTRYQSTYWFIVSNPPFAPLLPWFFRNRFSLLIYDVYPDALTAYNILSEKSPLVKAWKYLNQKVMAKAERIFTISEGMKELLATYVSAQAIEVVPIWTDNSFLKPLPKEQNPFIEQHSLANKFVVMYSGNLGYTHDIEALVEVAHKLKDEHSIQFLIIGEGEKKKLLEKQVKELELTNCLLLPWQPTETLPFSLAAADLGVVSLGKEASLLSIPSKTFNLMSVGAPLLCIADGRSELSRLVKNYQLGRSFSSNQTNAMSDFITQLSKDKGLHKLLQDQALRTSAIFGPENATKFVPVE